jgi:hypothetical protein
MENGMSLDRYVWTGINCQDHIRLRRMRLLDGASQVMSGGIFTLLALEGCPGNLNRSCCGIYRFQIEIRANRNIRIR